MKINGAHVLVAGAVAVVACSAKDKPSEATDSSTGGASASGGSAGSGATPVGGAAGASGGVGGNGGTGSGGAPSGGTSGGGGTGSTDAGLVCAPGKNGTGDICSTSTASECESGGCHLAQSSGTGWCAPVGVDCQTDNDCAGRCSGGTNELGNLNVCRLTQLADGDGGIVYVYFCYPTCKSQADCAPYSLVTCNQGFCANW